MIKLAIIGTGFIARSHAQAAAELPNCRLVALVNHRAESMAGFAKTFRVERQYRAIDALIADGDVDAVIICTPNALHAPQAIAALAANLHTLVEKPMALNAAEARTMLAAQERSRAKLQVAHCLRFLPDLGALRDGLGAGLIGRVLRSHSLAMHSRWGPAGWFTDADLAGGGALIDMGIHAIDAVRFVLGDPQPLSVYARIENARGGAVDDSGFLVVNWSNGALSTIEFGWWQPFESGVVAATRFVGLEGWAQLFPTRAERVDPVSGEIAPIAVTASDISDLDLLFADMYRAQLADFLDCIERDRDPMPGGREGLVNMRIVDAAYASSRSGEAVKIADQL